ncbi:MAG: glycosyl hydrolase 53 family protein [Treponema sp.]|jgi:arabinogalactan endo-1,4-beta-galactosidase|nr:glycosyl hydrolase 53 family protein [Treponema sp.]
MGPADETITITDIPYLSNIWVDKVEGLTDDFLRGMDISEIAAVKATGVVFRDSNGVPKDVFDILGEAGVNAIRIRVWNDPYFRQWDLNRVDGDPNNDPADHDVYLVGDLAANGTFTTEQIAAAGVDESWLGMPYGAGICDPAVVKTIAQQIADSNARTGKNIRMLIDFHYSDFWADPERQLTPKAWIGTNADQRAVLIREFTRDSLLDFASTGVTIAAVQIGNEINHGVAGFHGYDNSENDYDGDGLADAYEMLKAASAGVREFNQRSGQKADVVIHFTDPQELDGHKKRVEGLLAAGVDFDTLGTSFYTPNHGVIPDLARELAKVQAINYNGKKLKAMVVETGAGGSGTGDMETGSPVNEWSYSSSWQGQALNIRNTIDELVKMGVSGYFIWSAINLKGDRLSTAEQYAAIGWSSFARYCAIYDPNGRNSLSNADSVPYGSGSSSFFSDGSGTLPFGMAFPSLNVFKYMVTGSVSDKEDYPMNLINTETVIIFQNIDQKTDYMPEKVKVNFASGVVSDVPIVWRETGVTIPGANWWESPTVYHGMKDLTAIGDYNVIGDIVVNGRQLSVYCAVTVQPDVNYVQNPGFEEAGEAGGESAAHWTFVNALKDGAGADALHCGKATPNPRTGSFGCVFEDQNSELDMTAYQIIRLEPGTYHFLGYIQGSGAANTVTFFAESADDNGTAINAASATATTGWVQWKNPVVDFTVSSATNVKVGYRVECPGTNNWGTADDFILYKD